ncbi:MAG: (d)CMP kinase [Calditrichaeota bacterium]|nr:MAG: (d)CMP kinase [Calditrichota bacterium]MBL1206584.1 (d)CMP kinase [Calditrichota bacterium]NOG46411.1 (d)CMP kinase [Calditrichota bacterium]
MIAQKKLTIALDGPAASGKSTTARLLAKKIGYIYIDTGAMYRAVTLAVLKKGADPSNKKESVKIAQESRIELKIIDGLQQTFLNGSNVSTEIRTPKIDQAVSLIASNGIIREMMVIQQQAMAKKGGIVMDGRDIGTIVLPNADLKVFMIASIEARAQRRLKDRQNHNISLEEIKKDIERRDHIDSTRSDGPLRKASDAKELDNSGLSIEEQVDIILNWVKNLSTGEN